MLALQEFGVGHIRAASSLTACSSVGRKPGVLYPPTLFALGVGHICTASGKPC